MTPVPANQGSLLKYLQIIVLGAAILYFGKVLFIPMCYGLFIAIVLYPICKWLEKRGWPRGVAIAAGLFIVIILFGILVVLLTLEINAFRQDLPELLGKFKPSMLQLQQWIETNMGINIAAQNDWWANATRNLSTNAGSIVRSTITETTGILFTLFMTPVFAALLLYNRHIFVRFLEKIIDPVYDKQLHIILHETIVTYFHFIKGMVMVYIIVGILNSIGLLALGIRHAVLFGMLTAIMTIIPYIGIIISALLPISVAWITKDSVWYPIGVVAVFVFVQYLEANLIFPKVVASQLKVSTWATLVAIISGGIIWGVSGMILFIPFAGILKIVSDNIKTQEPIGILLSRD